MASSPDEPGFTPDEVVLTGWPSAQTVEYFKSILANGGGGRYRRDACPCR